MKKSHARESGVDAPNSALPARELRGLQHEVFNCRSHALSASVVFVYFVWRVAQASRDGTFAAWLVCASAACTVFVFAASAYYHARMHEKAQSAWLREVDYAAVILVICVSLVADLAIFTRHIPTLRISWQTWLDGLLAFAISTADALARRYCTSTDASYVLVGTPAHGTEFMKHMDGQWAPIRVGSILACLLGWILLVPLVWSATAPEYGKHIVLATYVAGTGLLVTFQANDFTKWTDRICKKRTDRQLSDAAVCCVATPSAHGWWHVAAFLTLASSSLVREIALYLW